jgi:hypothetical protein
LKAVFRTHKEDLDLNSLVDKDATTMNLETLKNITPSSLMPPEVS